jgi:hypothetical protein
MKLFLCLITLVSLSACSSFSFKKSENPANDVPHEMDPKKNEVPTDNKYFEKDASAKADSSADIRKDLNFMCRVRKEQARENQKPNADKATLAYKAAQKLQDNLKTKTVKKALEATSVMDPTKIHEAWNTVARQSENSDWSCPILTDAPTP